MSSEWTIKKMLDWCADFFSAKKIASPRLDAELLLAHVLNLRRLDLYLQFDRPLTETELAAFKTLVQRRSRREPVAYILGKKDFYSREFIVNSHVLIPRPDTEILIEAVLKKLPALQQEKILRGLDVGTGSGVIAITLTAERSDIHMTAMDVSEEALLVARTNAENIGVHSKINFHCDDFFAFRQDFKNDDQNACFDFIVSNPPYISETEYQTLMPDVKDFEPHQALVADGNGLAFYRKLAEVTKFKLTAGGLVAVEIGEEQKDDVENIFREAGLTGIVTLKDLAGLNRVVVGVKP